MALLLIAGIDTTWSAIGASLWHLASTPGDRERLVAEPELLPTAIEEFLRAYAPVTMARLVKRGHRLHGCPMKADDWVLLSFPAANRDPARSTGADEVIIDREVNRHAAFGLGIHRCVGSHLARMELRVALEVWLERIPSFTLADPAAVTWSTGQVRGPRNAPAAHPLTAAPPVAAAGRAARSGSGRGERVVDPGPQGGQRGGARLPGGHLPAAQHQQGRDGLGLEPLRDLR